MLQNSITLEDRYKKFITEVCQTQIIWGLEDANGFATSRSNDFETEEGDEAPLICFWSTEVQAKQCIKEEWSHYKPTQISLAMFLEVWCGGMYNDEAYAGIEFDQNLFGFEVDPLELGKNLIQEIKNKDYSIPLRQFKNLDEIEALFLTIE